MKNILIILLTLIAQVSFAQIPNAFGYQGLLLNADGYAIENKLVDFVVTISANNDGFDAYYQEVQSIETDKNGVFNFNIGEGDVLSGSMDDIAWLSSVPYIGIEYDLLNGEGINDLGFTQFNSVPFCFYSKYVVCQDGPKGQDGKDGAQGPIGPTGPPGATAATGATGQQGQPGEPITGMLNAVPTNAQEGTVYLDDGSNTEDGLPGFRYYDGSTWIQL